MGLTGWWVQVRSCCVLLGDGVGMGVDGGQFCQLLSTWCQPLSRFVTVGQAGVAGDGLGWALALLWGERHEVALLFWGERSRGWGEWRCGWVG